jgi:hypothetical protein
VKLKPRLRFILPFLFMFTFFVYQFGLGLIIGREAGFMLYIPAALLPLCLLGFPWFLLLMPEGSLDLTMDGIGTALALRYHAAAFVSLMLNALILSLVCEGLLRLVRALRGRSGPASATPGPPAAPRPPRRG